MLSSDVPSQSETTQSYPCPELDSGIPVPVPPNEESTHLGVASSLRKMRPSTPQRESSEPKRNRNGVLGENPLCEHCQRIDFQKVLDVDVQSLQIGSDGIFLADLGKRCNDISTNCPLCHLFYRSRIKPDDDSEYQLRIYSYIRSTPTIESTSCKEHHGAADIPCLGVVPAESVIYISFWLNADDVGHLFCVKGDEPHESLFTPGMLRQSAALPLVNRWLDFCTAHHSTCRERGSQVAGLKLLDCETHEVVSAPANACYVALSYVWGTTSSRSETSPLEFDGNCKIVPRITKTILNAAAAANHLGYKYLWVDKLCIDQDNAEEKHHQISQMDAVYGSADLTIIAACGQDCHYGLPGINGTPRTPQLNVKAGKFNVFSTMGHPRHHVQDSKWADRGWTLQEACLSTRRLVFTDSQLYFECNTMHCSESILPNLAMMHDLNGRPPSYFFQSRILCIDDGGPRGFFLQSKESGQQQQYLNLVERYTKRTLTFEGDRPKAFAGILKYFEKKSFFELWGVPYGPGNPTLIQKHFINGLIWAHERPLGQARDSKVDEGSSIDMTLVLPDGASIPSWSWMGWRGAISYRWQHQRFDCMVHAIRVEYGEDSGITLSNFHVMSKVLDPAIPPHLSQPKILLLEVDCIIASEIVLDEHGDLRVCGQRTSWYISRGPLQPTALYELFKFEKLELLLFGCSIGMDFSEVFCLMIVENHDDYAVRTGICTIELSLSLEPVPLTPNIEKKWIRLA